MFNTDQEVLSYIRHMASITDTSLEGWDIATVFNDPHATGSLIRDKRTINKILTTTNESKASVSSSPAMPDIESLVVFAQDYRKDIFLKELQNKQAELQSDINITLLNYARSLGNLRTTTLRIQEASGQFSVSLLEEVRQIVATEAWRALPPIGRVLRFVTATPIILTEKNSSLGVDSQVDFGQFEIRYDTFTHLLVVKPWWKTLKASNVFHPYISPAGIPCFGTLEPLARKLFLQGHLARYFSLLRALLYSYSADTHPYLALYTFKIHGLPENIEPFTPQLRCCNSREIIGLDDIGNYTILPLPSGLRHPSFKENCPVCEAEDLEECGCCQACAQLDSNCECCSVCGEPPGCDCCQECEHTDGNCERCRSCDSHEGHLIDCEHYEQPEEERE